MTSISAADIHHVRDSRARRLVNGRASIVSALVGAALWELIAAIAQVPFFPPLSAVVQRAGELTLDGTIPAHLLNSLANLGIGFAICVVLGSAIGILMGFYWRLDAALGLWVTAFLTAPALVLAPVFFSLFGLSRATPVAIIVFYSIFIVIINARAGVRAVRPDLVEMGRAFDARQGDLIRLVILPGAMPYLMAGIRLGAGRAVKGMINGEMFIAIVGLGGIIVAAGRVFDAVTVLAVLLVVVLVALVLSAVVERIDRRLTGWLPSTQRS